LTDGIGIQGSAKSQSLHVGFYWAILIVSYRFGLISDSRFNLVKVISQPLGPNIIRVWGDGLSTQILLSFPASTGIT
jgi:hypothetical protein